MIHSDSVGAHEGPLGPAWAHWESLGRSLIHLDLLGFDWIQFTCSYLQAHQAWIDLNSFGCTLTRRGFLEHLGLTWADSLGLVWVYLDLPGPTGSHHTNIREGLPRLTKMEKGGAPHHFI